MSGLDIDALLRLATYAAPFLTMAGKGLDRRVYRPRSKFDSLLPLRPSRPADVPLPSTAAPTKGGKKVARKALLKDGHSKTVVKTKPRKRKRKGKNIGNRALSKRIGKLERDIPTQTKHFWQSVPWTIRPGNYNRRTFFQVPAITSAVVESCIDSLDGVDFTTKNSRLKIACYVRNEIRNNSTAVMKFKYCYVRAKEDHAKNFIQRTRVDLEDRGLSFVLATTGETAASATTALVPFHQDLDNAEMQYPLFSARDTESAFDKLTKVETIILGPGDVFNVPVTFNWIYHPEDVDRHAELISPASPAATQVYKGDVFLICSAEGGIQHNETTNPDLVSLSNWRVDAVMYRKMKVKYYGDYGLKEYEAISSLNATNVTGPVQAEEDDAVMDAPVA